MGADAAEHAEALAAAQHDEDAACVGVATAQHGAAAALVKGQAEGCGDPHAGFDAWF